MTTRISTKGQIVLPAEIREQDAIGQEFEIERIERGKYLIKRKGKPRNEGLVDWLLSCLEKGFFVPVASDSTDTL